MMPSEILHIIKQKNSQKCNILDPNDLTKVNHDQGLFSMELTEKGQRFFFLLKYKYMFKLYKYTKDRHFYEVIPENYPCHLYFDIEFLFVEHKDFNGDQLVKDLVSLVEDKLFSLFGRTDYELIDLEATTEKKFSRHLIFHSDKFMFRNNAHVGHFVQTEILTHPEFAEIVDPAVYSRNRNFRCIWCTKKANGNKYPLVPKDKTNLDPDFSDLQYFLKTLISCKPTNKPHLIGYPELVKQESSKPKKRKVLHINSSSIHGNALSMIENPNKNSQSMELDIERFAIRSFAPNGYINKISYSPEFNTISMFVEGCKFCQHIGREHKSNHIYLICNLSQGYITQRCFDPDCRGYESPPVEIPYLLLQNLRQKYVPTNNNNSAYTDQFYPKKATKISSIDKIIIENSLNLSDDF